MEQKTKAYLNNVIVSGNNAPTGVDVYAIKGAQIIDQR